MVDIIKLLRDKFEQNGGKVEIHMLRVNKTFHAEITEEGILVDNLQDNSLLE